MLQYYQALGLSFLSLNRMDDLDDVILKYDKIPNANLAHNKEYLRLLKNFKEGNYLSIEFAGILKSSQNKEAANNFIKFILSNEFQSIIPTTNIMYPVIKIKDQLPEAYSQISIPYKPLQIDPVILNRNKEKWIDEWLNAL